MTGIGAGVCVRCRGGAARIIVLHGAGGGGGSKKKLGENMRKEGEAMCGCTRVNEVWRNSKNVRTLPWAGRSSSAWERTAAGAMRRTWRSWRCDQSE